MTMPAIATTAASVTMLLEIPVASAVAAPPVGPLELKNIVSPTSSIAVIAAINPNFLMFSPLVLCLVFVYLNLSSAITFINRLCFRCFYAENSCC